MTMMPMTKPMIDVDLLLTWGAGYRKYRKGDVIFREGEAAYFYLQLVIGKVRWVNVDEEGKEFIQAFVQEGESFGDLPLLDDGPYVATAIAEEDTTLLKLRKETFLQLLRENPSIHFSFSRLMTMRLRNKFIVLKELACQDPQRRIITILSQYKLALKEEPSGERVKVELTRQQIANMTGLRVETVIRTIRHLHERGLLHIDRGKVFC
jgi:CRP/FNR family transcriptional regulator, cyclic AMP receptor protein